MPRNIMQALNITPDGTLPKNAFDLHNYEYMTSKMGQFLPVGVRETVPDADYEMSVDSSTMTFPCNTAAMCQMKENFYFLFIPYSQIVNSAYAFFPNRKDNQSSIDYGYLKMPYFNLGDVVYECILKGAATGSSNTDIHGFNKYVGALRLLDLLGYGCYIDFLQSYKEEKMSLTQLDNLKLRLNRFRPNVLRIAAYQKAWYCYFRNTQYDTDISPRSFNFDDVVYTSDGTEPTYNVMSVRTLTQFIEECLQLRYVGYKKDIFTGSMPGTQFGAVSNITLADVGLHASITGATNYIGVNSGEGGLWSPTAHSRVSLFDSTESKYGDVTTGMDYVQAGSDTSSSAADMITNSYSGVDNQRMQVRTSHYHTLASDSIITLHDTNLFDVLQLVEAQAIQKWRQKSMLAGQRSINQYRAHYGVVPSHMEDHYPDFIGSVDNEIHISQVISQANTAGSDESNLGDLGGRGYGASDNKTFRFHSTEHGILMLCRSIVPENLYSSYGIDRANELINYSDFWQPEFQNIGLEAVPKDLLSTMYVWNSDSSSEHHDASSPLTSPDRVLGYAPRNYQLKQYPSRCHGMFNPNRTGQSYAWSGEYLPFGFSTMQAFLQSRSDFVPRVAIPSNNDPLQLNYIHMNLSKFYVNPSIANPTFAIDADSFEDTDEFIHFTRFNCKAVQPLSVLGLPQF